MGWFGKKYLLVKSFRIDKVRCGMDDDITREKNI